MRQSILSVLLMTLSFTLGGCSGWQSSLNAQGSQSDAIRNIFFVFLAIAAVVWIAVIMILVAGLRRRTRAAAGPLDLHPAFERRAGLTIFLLGIGTTVVVLALSLVSYAGQHVVFGKGANPLTVKIIGHQWWWEVRYAGDSPHRSFVSANEIRVPIGEPVKVELESADVIHSFWVPSLTGKMDLITGQQNQIEFTATKPGMYRGQCAEFCGIQHAHMAFTVHALQPDEFRAWRQHENENAHAPNDPLGNQGEETFRGRGCALCHAIRGTLSGGQLGPDLTHLASRTTIAAGTLPLSTATLGAWISDPQHIKPGNLMPQMALRSDEMVAILHYLEQLK